MSRVPMTEKDLAERAKRGSRQKFRKALSKVKDVEPRDRDKLKEDEAQHDIGGREHS
jgi:hypothetical protein